MSNIRFLQSTLDHWWNSPEYRERFPGFSKPQIVSGRALAKNCPLYFRRYLDQDVDSFYLLFQGDPRSGADITRDKACELLDDFFYEKLKMPSSFDIQAGGDLPRDAAVSKELLPAENDRNYEQYYDEQMAAAEADRAAAAADDEFEQKHGFRRDDPSIIDVAEPAAPASTTAVGAAASTAVGMAKPIWYGCCFHISAGGNSLGYNSSNRLGRRDQRASRGYLRESLGAA